MAWITFCSDKGCESKGGTAAEAATAGVADKCGWGTGWEDWERVREFWLGKSRREGEFQGKCRWKPPQQGITAPENFRLWGCNHAYSASGKFTHFLHEPSEPCVSEDQLEGPLNLARGEEKWWFPLTSQLANINP